MITLLPLNVSPVIPFLSMKVPFKGLTESDRIRVSATRKMISLLLG